MDAHDYELLDAGHGRKLERFGGFVFDRPCSQAVWKPTLPPAAWEKADAMLVREEDPRWIFRKPLPASWTVTIDGLSFELSTTDFGHVGVFPEHLRAWRWTSACIARAKAARGTAPTVLNLFAYSGGATLAAARAGAAACHLDASKKMVEWARRNAALNRLDNAPVRWIVDDAIGFLQREARRGRRYDGIILDPPSFGRGTKMELFKIDTALENLLDLCRQVLSEQPLFLFLSCHTPGYTPTVLSHLVTQTMAGVDGTADSGEMLLAGKPGVMPVPSGAWCGWRSAETGRGPLAE
jgi:23S rRNA (cytosine1962-C5)-methyltransferase